MPKFRDDLTAPYAANFGTRVVEMDDGSLRLWSGAETAPSGVLGTYGGAQQVSWQVPGTWRSAEDARNLFDYGDGSFDPSQYPIAAAEAYEGGHLLPADAQIYDIDSASHKRWGGLDTVVGEVAKWAAGYGMLSSLSSVLATYAPDVASFLSQGAIGESAATWAAEDAAMGAVNLGAETASAGAGLASGAAAGGDAISLIDNAIRTTGASSATEAANLLGFPSTEAYLASVDPNLLSAAGAGAVAGGAAASGPGWTGAGAETVAGGAEAAGAGGASASGGMGGGAGGVSGPSGSGVVPGVAGAAAESAGLQGLINSGLEFAKANPYLTAAGVTVAGGLLKGAADADTAKELLKEKTQQALELEQAKRGLIQSGSYFDARLPFAAPKTPRVLKRPDGTVVYNGGLINAGR